MYNLNAVIIHVVIIHVVKSDQRFPYTVTCRHISSLEEVGVPCGTPDVLCYRGHYYDKVLQCQGISTIAHAKDKVASQGVSVIVYIPDDS